MSLHHFSENWKSIGPSHQMIKATSIERNQLHNLCRIYFMFQQYHALFNLGL